jgi:hypothetical protein
MDFAINGENEKKLRSWQRSITGSEMQIDDRSRFIYTFRDYGLIHRVTIEDCKTRRQMTLRMKQF